jgi:Dehydratase family
MEAGLIDGSCMTVTGKTIAENLKDLPGLSPGQEIIKPLDSPIKESGHIQVGCSCTLIMAELIGRPATRQCLSHQHI